jgi:hypothetical protein
MIIASFPKGSFPESSWPVGAWPVAFIDTTNIQYTEVMEFAVCIAASADFDVVLPNDVETVTGTVTVSGAGTSEVNGTYAYWLDLEGKPVYTKGGGYNIWWDTVILGWSIYLDTGVDYYTSTDDVATPDLVTTWTVSAGSLPLPTVTSTAPLSGVSVTAAFTVEMPMIIDFELYEELSA